MGTRETFRRTIGAAEFRKSQANRDICQPRGSHRLTGPVEDFTLGGRVTQMRICADCQIWQVNDA